MNLTFAIPDLHGRADLLDLALRSVGLYAERHHADKRSLILLGDYVDKGPDSAGVIDRLIAFPPSPRHRSFELIPLMGNHDLMMIDALRHGGRAFNDWLEAGGGKTLECYGHRQFSLVRMRNDKRLMRHIDWLNLNLIPFARDRYRIYVHAGLDRSLPLESQKTSTLFWKYYLDDDEGGFQGLHIVHGHKPRKEGPLLLDGRTALDTMAWRTGRLAVGVFDDDKPGGPIDLILIGGAPAAATAEARS